MSIAERRAIVKAAFDRLNQDQADKRAEIARLNAEIDAIMPDLYRLQGQDSQLAELEAEEALRLAAPAESPTTTRRPRRTEMRRVRAATGE